MEWIIRYQKFADEYVDRHPNLQNAIRSACLLIDEGHDVRGIEFAAPGASINASQLAKIHALWTKTRTLTGDVAPDAAASANSA